MANADKNIIVILGNFSSHKTEITRQHAKIME